MENLFTPYTDSSAVFLSFPIVEHNCLGSWDIFLSLFHSCTMLPHPPLLVAIQDPPSRRSVLPMFPGFMSFAPPTPGRPRVAIYVSRTLNHHLSYSTVFHDFSEMLSEDVLSPEGLFPSPHRSLRVTSVYLLRKNRPPSLSIPPERVFSFLSCPPLVLGDLTSTILWQTPAGPCPKGNLQFLHATMMALSTSHTTFSTPPGFILDSHLTQFRDPLFWTWPSRIQPSPPWSPHGTRPSPLLVQTTFHV